MSISGLALSRVSHQAFGALEAAYVCVCAPVCVCIHVCAHIFLCDTSDSLLLYLFFHSPTVSVTQTHTHAHTHTCLPGGCRSVTG